MSAFLKNEADEVGFKTTEIYDKILLIEDFISQEEVQELLNVIASIKEEDWKIEYTSNLKRFCLEKFGRDDVENLVNEGKFEITRNWEDKNYNIKDHKIQKVILERIDPLIRKANPNYELSGMAVLQRMQEGVELKSHTDQHTDPAIQYATILYINDDYVDGEIFFKNINLKLKPKPGSMLVFPGTEEYEHGVVTVGPGPIRYVLTGFVKIIGFYDNNKYNDRYIVENGM